MGSDAFRGHLSVGHVKWDFCMHFEWIGWRQILTAVKSSNDSGTSERSLMLPSERLLSFSLLSIKVAFLNRHFMYDDKGLLKIRAGSTKQSSVLSRWQTLHSKFWTFSVSSSICEIVLLNDFCLAEKLLIICCLSLLALTRFFFCISSCLRRLSSEDVIATISPKFIRWRTVTPMFPKLFIWSIIERPSWSNWTKDADLWPWR